MEQNLQQVSGMVSQLHSMATDMNQEITTHNQILDRIDQKVCFLHLPLFYYSLFSTVILFHSFLQLSTSLKNIEVYWSKK